MDMVSRLRVRICHYHELEGTEAVAGAFSHESVWPK
jgi:hypothetical protein